MRAYIVPFGFFNNSRNGNPVPSFFLQQVDHLLPKYAGLIKTIGGEIEQGETPVQAALREMEEEVPGWFELARVPGTSKGFFGKKATSNGLVLIYEDSEIVVYAAYVDVGPVSWSEYRKRTKESCPVSLTFESISNKDDREFVFPKMREAIVDFMFSILL